MREPKGGSAPEDDEAPGAFTLLAAVAVAIAWWAYRGEAAPAPNIQRVFDSVADGHIHGGGIGVAFVSVDV